MILLNSIKHEIIKDFMEFEFHENTSKAVQINETHCY